MEETSTDRFHFQTEMKTVSRIHVKNLETFTGLKDTLHETILDIKSKFN